MDDEPVWVVDIQRAAAELGYEVKALQDSRQFDEAVAEWRPTLLALDIVMPDRDGVELLGALQRLEYDGPVILMSRSDPLYLDITKSLAEAHGLNVVALLQKPVPRDVVTPLLGRFKQG